MNVGSYLPSAQFVLIVASLVVSGGLVVAAEHYSSREKAAGELTAENSPTNNADIAWKSTLEEIQLESGISLPEPPNEETVSELLGAAQSSNLTESVSRTLLINLTSAAAQGLGSDIPTQEELVAQALTQINTREATSYTLSDLVQTQNTGDTLRSYGNAVMTVLIAHPKANVGETFRVLGSAVDNNNSALLKQLSAIGQEYRALAGDLAAVPVPITLAPLHLQIVNNFSHIAETYKDMEVLPKDPLRGLAGLQTYQSLIDETARVFTTIAQQFGKSAIIFGKDEPGSAWSDFLPLSP